MVHTQVFIIYIKIKIKLNTDNNLDLKVFWHHACTYYFGQLQQWMYLNLPMHLSDNEIHVCTIYLIPSFYSALVDIIIASTNIE